MKMHVYQTFGALKLMALAPPDSQFPHKDIRILGSLTPSHSDKGRLRNSL